MMTDPKLIQFVDTPFNVTYSASGQAFVLWPGGSNELSLNGYTQVSIEVGPSAHTQSFDVLMGKNSGATLSSRVGTAVPVGTTIHTYPVVGPEMALLLHGTPSTSDAVQLWVYLRP
jgi:hypothetical protein